MSGRKVLKTSYWPPLNQEDYPKLDASFEQGPAAPRIVITGTSPRRHEEVLLAIFYSKALRMRRWSIITWMDFEQEIVERHASRSETVNALWKLVAEDLVQVMELSIPINKPVDLFGGVWYIVPTPRFMAMATSARRRVYGELLPARRVAA